MSVGGGFAPWVPVPRSVRLVSSANAATIAIATIAIPASQRHGCSTLPETRLWVCAGRDWKTVVASPVMCPLRAVSIASASSRSAIRSFAVA